MDNLKSKRSVVSMFMSSERMDRVHKFKEVMSY